MLRYEQKVKIFQINIVSIGTTMFRSIKSWKVTTNVRSADFRSVSSYDPRRIKADPVR